MNLHKSKLQIGPTQKKALAFGNDYLAHLHLFHFICHSLSHPQCSCTTCEQTLPLASFKTASPCPTAQCAATNLAIKPCHWQVSINMSHAEMFQAGLLLALPPRWSGSRCCSPPVHAAGGAAALGLHALVHALPALCSDMNQLVLNFLLCVPLNYVINASFAS